MSKPVFVVEAYSVYKARPLRRTQHVNIDGVLSSVKAAIEKGSDFIVVRRVQPL